MKNFGLIFQYEIKKITHRKLWLIAFAAILLFTILLNLYTIFDYSVGWSGLESQLTMRQFTKCKHLSTKMIS